MRLFEFTDAKEQIALWKLISDSVWTSISTQAKQQAEAEAYKASLNKNKSSKNISRKSSPKFKQQTQFKSPNKNKSQLKKPSTPKIKNDLTLNYPQQAPTDKQQAIQNTTRSDTSLNLEKDVSSDDLNQRIVGTKRPSSLTS
jgi:hypothetical protein